MFTAVVAYVRQIETLLIQQIIPYEISIIINQYYRCPHISVSQRYNIDSSDADTDSPDADTDTSDESTSDENILESSSSDENTDRQSTDNKTRLLKWQKYWTNQELHDTYLPTKKLYRDGYNIKFEGISIKTNAKVCIRQIRRVFYDDISAKTVLRELKILRTLNGHDSIIQLYEILPPVDAAKFKTLTIILEHVDNNLKQIFKTNQYFSSFHIQYILYHMILGVNHMHRAGIVHRDLKPSNILINANCSVKICDFYLARGFPEDIVLDKKEQRKKRRRKRIHRVLTAHVLTRWYRAPEIILLQQNINKECLGIDIWSIGCIFGELLQMKKENCTTIWKRGPLFPHDSYFPFLSPKRNKKKNRIYQSHFDQIRVIFEVLGTPKDEEIESLNDEQARAYLEDLPKQNAQNLYEMFPGTNNDGINLLTTLLKFDVKKRLNIKQTLNHSYFNRVRIIDLENVQSPKKFDFEGVSSFKRKELNKLILQEVLCYHPNEKSRFENVWNYKT